jgi:hypothetical protein
MARPGGAPAALLLVLVVGAAVAAPAEIPLPEHPRPDFERGEWLNLNGPWTLRFDPGNVGERDRWFDAGPDAFPRRILVPFPWGSPLAGVPDEADVAWYARDIRVPGGWAGKRIFLVVGASDWRTRGWLDGHPLGVHQGGYTPFAFELTTLATAGRSQRLVLQVDDTPHPFKLEGKQGYGPARGLWQTVYLEARPALFVDSFEFHPDLAARRVTVQVRLSDPAPIDTGVSVELDGAGPPTPAVIRPGASAGRVVISVAEPRPWTLEDPYLYPVTLRLRTPTGEDVVRSYLGFREISVAPLPGDGPTYVALNGRPIYLQMTLDQGWNPEGFTTWPSDAAMRREILIARRLGLNAIRTHVKVELPRKLYWADRLGVLVMSDVPNSWGEPGPEMRAEWETAFRGMVRRDFNHPAIFSWVLFNEQWGLYTRRADGSRAYLPETQEWVASRVDLAKRLDPTRLVEDNSVCCGSGHVQTDLNSWHMYLPGWKWREVLDEVVKSTFPGSTWNFLGGRTQGEQPNLNSECGNVWGYEGSTGDVDWSFDYHAMIDEFRRHLKVAGWLYTEHHDVVNEWNGYVRADRSPKETGLAELVPGMSLRDLHSAFYVAPGSYPVTRVEPGQVVDVPVWASFLTDEAPGGGLRLRMELVGHDDLGRFHTWWTAERVLPFAPWMSAPLEPVSVAMPAGRALAVLRLVLEDGAGRVLHRNFTAFVVGGPGAPRDEVRVGETRRRERLLRVAPGTFQEARFSLRQWEVMDGLKVNGAGFGYFEYRLPWPADLRLDEVDGADFVAELGAKELFGKDRPDVGAAAGDYMRGQGTHDPGANPNAYPMTDTRPYPSAVRIRINGVPAGIFDLPDDPADHRGLLSWAAQKRDGRLREAGSYGYLVSTSVPARALRRAAAAGVLVLRLEVDGAEPGGLAIYGESFGRYPLDPTVVLSLRH